MYVFYEHHRDAAGAIALTEMRLSSRKERFEINFNVNKEKAIFELAKVVLKNAPVSNRSYDLNMFVWQYIGPDYGNITLAGLQSVTAALGGITPIEVDDLAGYCRLGGYNPELRAKRPKAEDFFYTHEPTKTAVSKESVVSKLTALLEVPESELIHADKDALKKLYRRACLKLHPDRNNGNGAMMAELNMYWGIYNG